MRIYYLRFNVVYYKALGEFVVLLIISIQLNLLGTVLFIQLLTIKQLIYPNRFNCCEGLSRLLNSNFNPHSIIVHLIRFCTNFYLSRIWFKLLNLLCVNSVVARKSFKRFPS